MAAQPAAGSASDAPAEATLRKIYEEALVNGQAYQNLDTLVKTAPGRLAGSPALDRAIAWGKQTLGALQLDRVYTQDVQVPHWERGPAESVIVKLGTESIPLTAVALGGSGPSPEAGVTAEVVEVKSLAELATLGRDKLAGKIVFFNRPMDPTFIATGRAYGAAGDQRNAGPGAAAKYGAAGALVRSLTLPVNDVPHTGATTYPPDVEKIPAVAVSTIAANRLHELLGTSPQLKVELKVHSKFFPDAPSNNVIGEIRGSEKPNEFIVVGGHIDSWDIAPGAHDDGAGVVESIEVLRIFRALGLKPRHTLRCVLFTNEENGARGAAAYASAAREAKEKHILAVETDNGGFQPRGFNLGSTQGEVQERAARWRPLFEPYGLYSFTKGEGGTDVHPLMVLGSTVAGLTPDSQRYFDYHHTRIDTMDKVNARELEIGAASLAALIWLVDTQGL